MYDSFSYRRMEREVLNDEENNIEFPTSVIIEIVTDNPKRVLDVELKLMASRYDYLAI